MDTCLLLEVKRFPVLYQTVLMKLLLDVMVVIRIQGKYKILQKQYEKYLTSVTKQPN